MSQLNKWMLSSKISKLVVVITSKETGETVERWQFDVQIFGRGAKKHHSKDSGKPLDKENAASAYDIYASCSSSHIDTHTKSHPTQSR